MIDRDNYDEKVLVWVLVGLLVLFGWAIYVDRTHKADKECPVPDGIEVYAQ